MKNDEFGFIDYINIFLKWKKVLLGGTFITGVIVIIISLLLPKWYKASVVIMPPSSDGPTGITGLMSSIPLSSFGLGAEDKQTQICLAILKSRTLTSNIIDKFNLIDKYESPNKEEAIKSFSDNIILETSDEGAIFISVYDKDQEIVADIANEFVIELDQINKRLMTERARNNRIFIEGRVHETKERLRNIEDKIKEFQESTFIIDLDTQTKAVIETSAQLKAEILMTEVEIEVLNNTVAPSNPEIYRLQIKLRELEKKYKQMNFASKPQKLDIFPIISKLPEQGLEYIRMIQEAEIQKKMLEYLLPEYEQAKISEAKDTPTIQVLDYGVRPERKSKPRRALLVIGATFGMFILLWIGVITREGYHRYLLENKDAK